MQLTAQFPNFIRSALPFRKRLRKKGYSLTSVQMSHAADRLCSRAPSRRQHPSWGRMEHTSVFPCVHQNSTHSNNGNRHSPLSSYWKPWIKALKAQLKVLMLRETCKSGWKLPFIFNLAMVNLVIKMIKWLNKTLYLHHLEYHNEKP